MKGWFLPLVDIKGVSDGANLAYGVVKVLVWGIVFVTLINMASIKMFGPTCDATVCGRVSAGIGTHE